MMVRLAVLMAVAAGLAGPVVAGAGDADPGASGAMALQELRRAGEIMPFDVIQRRVLQDAPGEYVGAQFDAGSRRYRFRFMRDGNVINVDVDARTGERLRPRQSY
ncbi:MAG: hypothetical protein KGQ52_10795 [Alphaproteobacteria bacterium]|nr:hypothetical protein [Alphaproteobacteria bacterium]